MPVVETNVLEEWRILALNYDSRSDDDYDAHNIRDEGDQGRVGADGRCVLISSLICCPILFLGFLD